MFPKKQRIVRQKEIQHCLKTKYKTYTTLVNCLISYQSLKNFRILVIVTKKAHKKAHKRNKLRRQIHYIFQKLELQEKLPKNVDCILIFRKKEIFDLNFSQLEEIIISNFSKTLTYSQNSKSSNFLNRRQNSRKYRSSKPKTNREF